MSEPGSVAQILGLSVDPDARAYFNSITCRATSEYTWPAVATPYQAIRRLLPNHYLELGNGACTRFWPDRALCPVTVEQCVDRAAELLRGLMRAAANRFDLAIALTAGLDSRLVLAASRDIKDAVSFVTVRQWHMPDDSPDVAIPAALLASLGLHHEVIRASQPVAGEFKEVFDANVFLAHDYYAPDAEAILKRYGRNKVTVTGSGGEVGRCAYRQHLPFFDHKPVTSAYLSRLELGVHNEFGVQHFADWLKGINAKSHINRLDLFEWEHGCGSWLAMTQLEFDIAWKDILTPFNCRELLVTMLSTPVRSRKGPNYPLFRHLIRDLWPELLDVPINPHTTPSPAQQGLNAGLELLRHLVQHLRNR